MFGILWAIFVILLVFWALGLVFHIAGGLIHILLVIAVIVFLYNLFIGSRSRSPL
ncbi:MAG: lmo0937 family membrane protein [Chloroflexi bacterium]|nr:lmo0937 family membrane protein [Ktedonobacteraceae bacterium]MBV9019220.1 lmo0937 family membrane protein [Ktedonobacteraceae bacterium]MBV9708764.1 lmo0937 family membrane protein [Chloroflexota bacterium]